MTDEFDLSDFLAPKDTLKDPQLIMFYGPYGQGKTYMSLSASQVEDLAPVLVIDLEGSTTGVIDNFDQDKVDVIRPKERWPGNEWRATKQLLNNLITQPHKYKTVVIDPLNTLFEWGKTAGDKPGDGFAKWNFVHDEFTSEKGLVSRLKSAPFLAILVVHQNLTGGEDDTLPFADFRWQGQGTAFLGQFPDMVGYVTRDTNAAGVSTSTLHTAPTKRNNAKNRFGLPAKMVDPSMAKIYAHIRSENEEDK